MEQFADARASETDESVSLPWRDVVRSVFRHQKMILAFAAAGAIIMAAATFLEAPGYEADTTLMLVAKRADAKVSPDERSVTQVERIDDTVVNSEARWLQSEGVLRKVLEPWREKVEAKDPTVLSKIVDAATFPIRIPGMLYRRIHGAPEPSAFDGWVDSVQKRLTVNPVKLSSVIEISYTDSSPQFSAQLLNALIAERMKREKSLSQQDETIGFYDEQSRLLADHVRQAEAAVQAFYEREGIVGGPDERKALRDRLTETRGVLARARTELSEARSRSAFLQKAIERIPQHIKANGNPAGSIQNQVLDLMLQRSKLLATYAPTSVKIVDLDHQIAEAKRMLHDEAQMIAEGAASLNPTYADLQKELIQTQAQLVALEARTTALTDEERGYLDQMKKSVEGSGTLEQLEADLEHAREAHKTYVAKREEARFSSALDTSQILNITVAIPPAVPTTPLPRRQGANSLLGGVAGLVVGIALAYALDLLSPTVKSAAEVARLTHMPILGEVTM